MHSRFRHLSYIPACSSPLAAAFEAYSMSHTCNEWALPSLAIWGSVLQLGQVKVSQRSRDADMAVLVCSSMGSV